MTSEGRAPAPHRRRTAIVVGAIAVLLVGAGVFAWVERPVEPAASAPVASPTATATPTPTPSPTPTVDGPPADTTAYDLAGLPQVDVFAILPALPVDTDRYAAFPGGGVRSVADAAPVFPAPGQAPVARLPRDYIYGGTTVPVIERHDNWVRVLLVGRQATPSTGDPTQLTGWLRTQDVEAVPLPDTVEVSLSARTIDIVHDGAAERIAGDFASGTDVTPTPLGRAFVMTVRVEPTLTYTRDNPITYLSVQSPTLDGFAGADAAITAFHYHDDRSGAISNGCIRVDAPIAARLAQLPLGTPVVIRP